MSPFRARRALWRLMNAAETEIDAAAREAAAALEGATEREIFALVNEAARTMGQRIAGDLLQRLERAINLGVRAGFSAMGEGDRAAAEWFERHGDLLIARFSPRVQQQPEAAIRRGMVELQKSIQAGEGAQQAAYRMRDIGGHEPSPVIAQTARQVAVEARRAVLAAGPDAQARFGREVQRLQGYAQRLGRDMRRVEGYSMRGATLEYAARMRDAVQRMRPDLIERAAKYHVYHKVAYHERLTARTEMARSFNGTFVESAKSLGCEKVRYVLNKVRHEHGCGCDYAAIGHSPGCPRGVYVIGQEPEIPIHPNCMCYYETYFDD